MIAVNCLSLCGREGNLVKARQLYKYKACFQKWLCSGYLLVGTHHCAAMTLILEDVCCAQAWVWWRKVSEMLEGLQAAVYAIYSRLPSSSQIFFFFSLCKMSRSSCLKLNHVVSFLQIGWKAN